MILARSGIDALEPPRSNSSNTVGGLSTDFKTERGVENMRQSRAFVKVPMSRKPLFSHVK